MKKSQKGTTKNVSPAKNQKISSFFKPSTKSNNESDDDFADPKKAAAKIIKSLQHKKRKPISTNENSGAPPSKKVCDKAINPIEKTPTKQTNIIKETCSPECSRRSPLEKVTLNVEEKKSKKTPLKGKQKARQRTPSKKLFEKSPVKLGDFNVEILNKFVKVTPSKSSVRVNDSSPSTSVEKIQKSLLDCISPSKPSSSKKAQCMNEMTPTKSPGIKPKKEFTPHSKAKMMLNFTDDKVEFGIPKNEPKCTSVLKSSCSKISTKTELKTENKPETSGQRQNLIENEIECDEMNSEAKMVDGLNDSFNDIDFDDWEIEMEKGDSIENYTLDLQELHHCKIITLQKYTHIDLTVQSTLTKEHAKCTLNDFWVNTKLSVGDTITIMGKKQDSGSWLINNNYGLIVYEPDLLISITTIVGSVFCKRRSFLSDRFHGFDPPNIHMILGILVHTLLQDVLKYKLNTTKEVEQVLEKNLSSIHTVKMMYDAGLKMETIKEEALKFIPRITEFVDKYVNSRTTKRNINKGDWEGRIKSIADIEENIWCPELGIKGKVDVSVRNDNHYLPLELKTGRATVSLEHRGQVLLYIMMMTKLGYNVPSGLLLYLREGVLKEIPMSLKEQRDIMILRNELTYYLLRQPTLKTSEINCNSKKLIPPELPEPIYHPTACGKCPYNSLCTAYLVNEKADLLNNKPLENIRNSIMEFLQPEHIEYFIKWCSLIELEESSSNTCKELRDIYTLKPEERETKGRSIVNLKITNISDDVNGIMSHTFEKGESSALNFLASGIGESSYVVISTTTRPAVVTGFVTYVDSKSITVTLEKNLTKKFPSTLFHIDTYDSSISRTYNLTSLALLLENSDKSERLRRLIINQDVPTFATKLPTAVFSKGKPILLRLNKIQQRAILKAYTANDYLLINGMPGTGKTATIVAFVQLMAEIGKTILISSHTHSAVDNVCLRLIKYGVDFIRLGSASRFHKSLAPYSEHARTKHCKTPEELEAVYNKVNVLAVTCLGSSHALLSKRTFDFCVIDESTQVLQSTVIKVLYAAKTFVLIGDPDQLPPVVKNKDAVKLGMSVSLFERLKCKEGTITLDLNYRMNKTITALANNLTYNGSLLIGSEDVGNACLSLPKIKSVEESYKEFSWVLDTLSSSLENAVQFVDTGAVWNKDYSVDWLFHNKQNNGHTKIVNIYEAAVIFHIVKAIIQGGENPENIGVISTYNAQVSQLSSLLEKYKVEISTVDRFQGQDKNVIVYSCAKSRSNADYSNSNPRTDILDDARRLNVAITRAKHKLIIVGDAETVKHHQPFAKLLEYVNDKHILKLEGYDGFSWKKVLDLKIEKDN